MGKVNNVKHYENIVTLKHNVISSSSVHEKSCFVLIPFRLNHIFPLIKSKVQDWSFKNNQTVKFGYKKLMMIFILHRNRFG